MNNLESLVERSVMHLGSDIKNNHGNATECEEETPQTTTKHSVIQI